MNEKDKGSSIEAKWLPGLTLFKSGQGYCMSFRSES